MNRSIIYVNFSPYENAGKILDYLLKNFRRVFLFSLTFYKLGKKQKTNKLKIYELGKLRKEFPLYQIPVPASLLFPLLPIRSILIFLQILGYAFFLKMKFGKVDYYFTVNAFTAWIGIVLKKINFVEKVIFWVWDYYPPRHQDKIIRLMRWIYWQFDKKGINSDRLVFLNSRLLRLRKNTGVLPKSARHSIVPIGTHKGYRKKHHLRDEITIGFFGVLKKSEGLDIVFDNSKSIKKVFPSVKLDIIGSGPDEKYYKKRSETSKIKTVFHGFIPNQTNIDSIMSNWDIGIAPYVPDESNASYYGDPSKIKKYLSLGIPVVTTKVFVFSGELRDSGAGVIFSYNKGQGLIKALSKIISNYSYYRKNAVKLANKYNYEKIYSNLFKFV